MAVESIQSVDVDNTAPTLANAGVRLPVSEISLAELEEHTFRLVSDRADYDFNDVVDIKFKDGTNPESVTLVKMSTRSFKLVAQSLSEILNSKSGHESDTELRENITVQVLSSEGYVDITFDVVVIRRENAINATLNKNVIDICPGNEVSFGLIGTDADTAVITDIINPDSPLKINKNKQVFTVAEEGEFINGVTISKDGLSKKLYIQASSKRIISVDPNSVSINTAQTQTINIAISGDDYNMSSNKVEVCTVDKTSRVITPVGPGSAIVSVTGSRGDLRQTIDIPVNVRAVVQPQAPILLTQDRSVDGGERLTLNFSLTGEDRLVARVEGDGTKGTLVTNLNKLVYTAHTPDSDENVVIYFKTTSVDGIDSDESNVTIVVKGVPTTQLVAPDSLEVKEGETIKLDLKTDARSIFLTSSVPDLLGVNSSQKTITGLNYGSANLIINAQAINRKAIEETIPVLIKPGDLSRPTLKTKVTQVQEEEMIELEFTLDSRATLELTVAGDLGEIEVNGNKATWLAPTLINAERQAFTFKAVARREEVNVSSPSYIFYVTVTKKKSEDGDNQDQNTMPMTDIEDIIKDEQLTFKEKIAILSKSGNQLTKDTVRILTNYEETMNDSNRDLTEEEGAGRNYDLYLAIKRVIETKDNDTFQALFSLINLVFKEYANSAYDRIKLQRFDRQWPGGNKNLYTYQNIVTCISFLCNIMERKGNLRQIDFSVVFNKEKTAFKEVDAQSVIKYYTL